MKITVLGSMGAIEALPDRHHTSILLETGGETFMLDAGECCARTMHLLGMDVRRIETIFISHPHIDHMGGLPYLMFIVKKMHEIKGSEMRKVHIYASENAFIEGVKLMFHYKRGTEAGFMEYHHVEDGVIYDTPLLRVEARHNEHMSDEDEPPFRSFSYRLEAEGKTVVYSGDVKDLMELDGWFDCDLLMIENGHHNAEHIYQRLMQMTVHPKRLLFVHNHRKIIADAEGFRNRAKAVYDGWVDMADDGMTIEF